NRGIDRQDAVLIVQRHFRRCLVIDGELEAPFWMQQGADANAAAGRSGVERQILATQRVADRVRAAEALDIGEACGGDIDGRLRRRGVRHQQKRERNEKYARTASSHRAYRGLYIIRVSARPGNPDWEVVQR